MSMFNIFRNWKEKEAPHVNCRNVLWATKSHGGEEQYKKYIERTGSDGADLLALRDQYKKKIRALEYEISSTREAIECIDGALARLAAHEAWQSGYEGAEQDLKPKRRSTATKAQTAKPSAGVVTELMEGGVASA